MRARHMIFDLDGTLVDTRRAATATWHETLSEFGLTLAENQVADVFGMTSACAFARWGLAEPQGFDDRWVENYAHHVDKQRLFPQAVETLQGLREQGFGLGVVSSRTEREFADYMGRLGLESLCPLMVLADDTERHKPDPDPLLLWCKRAGTEPGDCVYVGDTAGDEQAAASAGMPFAAASWAEGSGPFTARASLVRKVSDLLAWC